MTNTEIKAKLDEKHPTHGDGEWSLRFIDEVLAGKHSELPNAQKVLSIASDEP